MLEVLDCLVMQVFRRVMVQESMFYNSMEMKTPRNMVDVLKSAIEFIKCMDDHKLTRG